MTFEDPFDRRTGPTGMRASDAEREQAADALRGHHAEGRLSDAEFEQRVSRCYSARTHDELEHLFADLPTAARRPLAAAGGYGPLGRVPRRHLFALVLGAVAVLSVLHWLLFATVGPWHDGPWHGGPPIIFPLIVLFLVWRFGLRRGRRQAHDRF